MLLSPSVVFLNREESPAVIEAGGFRAVQQGKSDLGGQVKAGTDFTKGLAGFGGGGVGELGNSGAHY